MDVIKSLNRWGSKSPPEHKNSAVRNADRRKARQSSHRKRVPESEEDSDAASPTASAQHDNDSDNSSDVESVIEQLYGAKERSPFDCSCKGKPKPWAVDAPPSGMFEPEEGLEFYDLVKCNLGIMEGAPLSALMHCLRVPSKEAILGLLPDRGADTLAAVPVIREAAEALGVAIVRNDCAAAQLHKILRKVNGGKCAPRQWKGALEPLPVDGPPADAFTPEEGQHYYRLVQQKLAELEAASNNKQSTETAILKELLKRLLVDNKEAVLGLLPQKGLDKLAKEDEDWEDSVLLSAAKSLGMPRVHNGCAAMQVYNILRGVRRVVTGEAGLESPEAKPPGAPQLPSFSPEAGKEFYTYVQQALQTIEDEPLRLLLSHLRVRSKEAVLGLLPAKGEDKLDAVPVLSQAAEALGVPPTSNNCAAAQLNAIVRTVLQRPPSEPKLSPTPLTPQECHKCFKDIELALQTIEEEPLKLLMSNLRVRTKEALLALLPLKGEDKLDSLPVLSYAAKSLGCQMVLNNSAAAQLLKLIQAAEAAKEGLMYYDLVKHDLATMEDAPLKALLSALRLPSKEAVLGLLPAKGEDKLDAVPVLREAAEVLGSSIVWNNSAAAQLHILIRAANKTADGKLAQRKPKRRIAFDVEEGQLYYDLVRHDLDAMDGPPLKDLLSALRLTSREAVLGLLPYRGEDKLEEIPVLFSAADALGIESILSNCASAQLHKLVMTVLRRANRTCAGRRPVPKHLQESTSDEEDE